MHLSSRSLRSVVLVASVAACGESTTAPEPVDQNISPSSNADAGSSYQNSLTDAWIAYSALPRPASGGAALGDAIAYLDADGDGDTDVFMATGEYLSEGDHDSELFLNDGSYTFTYDVAAFGGSPPPATHARKSLVADFDGNGRDDVLILDHGFDSHPFPGSEPKLVLQDSPGSFSWQRLSDQTGFHHGGAAGDVDNDGDIDVFIGGFDPFFYVNDGSGGFSKVDDRWDGSMAKVFSAELIDVDQDGYLDLLVGAHERDGDQTAVYWGNSTGAYGASDRTLVPQVAQLGAVLDFEAADVDGDGDRDLILNRTRDGDDGAAGGFYNGRLTQLVLHDGSRAFIDATGQIDAPGTGSDPWFPWLRTVDLNQDGDLDIVPDDAGIGYVWVNDGAGMFTRTDWP